MALLGLGGADRRGSASATVGAGGEEGKKVRRAPQVVLDGAGVAGALGAGVEPDPPSVLPDDVVPAPSLGVEPVAPASELDAADELVDFVDFRLSVL